MTNNRTTYQPSITTQIWLRLLLLHLQRLLPRGLHFTYNPILYFFSKERRFSIGNSIAIFLKNKQHESIKIYGTSVANAQNIKLVLDIVQNQAKQDQ
jgi:hypothetical protein